MLEQLSFEWFGAFGAVLLLLGWIANYFRKKYEQAQEEKNEIIRERSLEKQKEIDVLEKTLEVLQAQLEKEREE